MRETLRRKTLETKEKNNTREMDVRLCVEEKIRVEGQQFSFSRNRGKKNIWDGWSIFLHDLGSIFGWAVCDSGKDTIVFGSSCWEADGGGLVEMIGFWKIPWETIDCTWVALLHGEEVCEC